MTTSTPTKPNHALDNCKGQLETIVELYKLRDLDDDDRDIMQEAQDMALDVCWKSDDWQAVGAKEGFSPTKGRVLLSWGGPACQVICDLEYHQYASNPEIQYQDWGTPWTSHCDLIELERTALEWFVNQFWWGE